MADYQACLPVVVPDENEAANSLARVLDSSSSLMSDDEAEQMSTNATCYLSRSPSELEAFELDLCQDAPVV